MGVAGGRLRYVSSTPGLPTGFAAGLTAGEAVAFVSSNCKLLFVPFETASYLARSSWSSLK